MGSATSYSVRRINVILGVACLLVATVVGANATSGVQLRFQQPVGTALNYTTTSSVSFNGHGNDPSVTNKIHSTNTTQWQIATVSRDGIGTTEAVMPAIMDGKEVVENPNNDPDTTKRESAVFTLKLDAKGDVLDSPGHLTGGNLFSWLQEAGILYPGVTIIPYPEQAISVGSKWSAVSKSKGIKSYCGSLQRVDAELVGTEVVNGHKCAKIVYTLFSKPGAMRIFNSAVQTVWVDIAGGFPVKCNLDVSFHYTHLPDLDHRIHSETILYKITKLTSEQLDSAKQCYDIIKPALEQLSRAFISQSAVPDKPRAQRYAIIKKYLQDADVKVPYAEWKQGIKGLSELELKAEEIMKNEN